MRLRRAGAVPRRHVLRDLGLAREQPAACPGSGGAVGALRWLAAVAAVPGRGNGDRLPAGTGPAPGGCGRPGALPRLALMAAAAAPAVRHGGGGGTTGLLRGRRAA